MQNKIIEEKGNKYTVIKLSDDKEIKIRHPKGRDLRFAMSGGILNDADMIFKITSNITCLSEAELDELEAKDLATLLKVVSGFLA